MRIPAILLDTTSAGATSVPVLPASSRPRAESHGSPPARFVRELMFEVPIA